MTRLAAALALIALPVALLAQQGTNPTQTPPRPKPPVAEQTPTAPVFPVGTYTTQLQDGTKFEVTFAEGKYIANQDGQQVAVGKYSTTGAQILMSDNSDSCGMAGEALYTWAFDGKALTFKLSRDGCDIRAQILTGQVWTKK